MAAGQPVLLHRIQPHSLQRPLSRSATGRLNFSCTACPVIGSPKSRPISPRGRNWIPWCVMLSGMPARRTLVDAAASADAILGELVSECAAGEPEAARRLCLRAPSGRQGAHNQVLLCLVQECAGVEWLGALFC